MPLDGQQGLLADVSEEIGALLSPDELRMMMYRVRGKDIFVDLVAEPDSTHVHFAFDLLLTLDKKEPQNVPEFLARVLRRCPGNERLRELVGRWKPEALEILARLLVMPERVLPVKASLDSVLQRVADDDIRKTIARSRDCLSTTVLQIDRLTIYKGLHDALHGLQITPFGLYRAAAQRIEKDDDQLDTLSSHVAQIETTHTSAVAIRTRAREYDPTSAHSHSWIEDLEQHARELRKALDERSPSLALKAIFRVRAVLERQSPALSRLIYETAKALPTSDLAGLLGELAKLSGGDLATAEEVQRTVNDRRAATLELHYTLVYRVTEHKLWQDFDDMIWALEQTLDSAPEQALREFRMLWLEAKPAYHQILSLAAAAPARPAKIDDMKGYSDAIEVELAREVWTPAIRQRFGIYQRTARTLFFGVDTALKEDCSHLASLRDPLRAILDGATHV